MASMVIVVSAVSFFPADNTHIHTHRRLTPATVVGVSKDKAGICVAWCRSGYGIGLTDLQPIGRRY